MNVADFRQNSAIGLKKKLMKDIQTRSFPTYNPAQQQISLHERSNAAALLVLLMLQGQRFDAMQLEVK